VFSFNVSSNVYTHDNRAGLPLEDPEFVQFHPTGVYGAGCLITEGTDTSTIAIFSLAHVPGALAVVVRTS
jgi:hypothetical protein